MNYLNKTSEKNSNVKLRVIINSFTGNPQENAHSEEILQILKAKNIKISDVMDINQDMVFEKEKSKILKLIF